MNVRFAGDGGVVSVGPSRSVAYDMRAVADKMDSLMAEALASGWEKLPSGSPNWVRQVGNPSNVRNLNQEAMAWLDANPTQPKTEVVYQDEEGVRNRYLLTPDEVAAINQTGILPDAANVTARFKKAVDWTVETPSSQAAGASKKGLIGLALAAVAAYLYFK